MTGRLVKNIPHLSKGDLILLSREVRMKSDPLFEGPYLVVNVKGPNVVILINNITKTVHVNRIKKYSIFLFRHNRLSSLFRHNLFRHSLFGHLSL